MRDRWKMKGREAREEPDDASGRQQKEESKSQRQNRRDTKWNSKSLIQQIQHSRIQQGFSEMPPTVHNYNKG